MKTIITKEKFYEYRHLLWLIPIFVIGLFIGSFGYLRFLDNKVSKNPAQTGQSNTSPTPHTDYVPSDESVVDPDSESFDVLLLGHGGAGHSGGSLMDSIVAVHVEPKSKKAVLISIPRDLWYQGHKINSEYSMSPGLDGWNRMKNAASNITGLRVNNFAAIDFSNFIKAIDSLDGLEIDVTSAYTDRYYPVRGLENELCGKSPQEVADLHTKYSGFELEKQFECRYETINFEVGKKKINGDTALKYVRSRHGDGDFGRSNRQFTILKGLAKASWNLESVESLLKIVKTDLGINRIKSLVELFGNPSEYDIKTVHLTTDNVLKATTSSQGAYILIPQAGADNYSEVKDYITK